VLAVLFAQLVTAAHACTVALAPPQSVAAADNDTMPSDCAGNAKTTRANVCESHCLYGQQIDVHPDVPAAAVAPQPALISRAAQSIAWRSFDTIALHARSSAPPLSVLFSRFLN